MYIADTFNNRVRKVDPSGIILTAAGNGFNFYSGDGGAGTVASLAAPKGLAADTLGNLFIADSQNYVVRKVDTNGIITTAIGDGIDGFTPITYHGSATNTRISSPYAVAVAPQNSLFLSDLSFQQIIEVNSSGLVGTLAGPGTNNVLSAPRGLASDATGNLYIANRNKNIVYRINAAGVVTTFAGGGASLADGIQATNALIESPEAVAFDASGNLFISIAGQSRVRKVDANGIITTVAGNGTSGYFGDGAAATNAALNQPSGLVLDGEGNVYIADSSNNRVRRVDASGIISTVAGNGTAGYFGDGGQATAAWLNGPVGLAMDPGGNLYVSDSANNRVRQVLLQGSPTLLLNNANSTSVGSYQVVVSNQWGTATSQVATLTVTSNVPQIVFKSVVNHANGSLGLGGTANPGTPLVLNVATNMIPPIHWERVATNTTGADGQWEFNPATSASVRGGYFRVSTP